ncbi:DUF4158 domain-containing protein [Streptomyces alanosinicus]|uniref:DUF4158 domain-containing protein n=1 Tax=Streptomyces alanosinicus TaxID=68171 RepID=UPI001679FC5C|nr:DUF4158 domain-containing protein [Streptomyces alanosinicus]
MAGRFPKPWLELPRDAVEHVARQVQVAARELAQYAFTSRTTKRHRTEIRDLTGWHECTGTDLVKLTSWLADEIWHNERRAEAVRAEPLRHLREKRIEPTTADQISTVVRPALHQAEDHAIGEVADWLARAQRCTWRLDTLHHPRQPTRPRPDPGPSPPPALTYMPTAPLTGALRTRPAK